MNSASDLGEWPDEPAERLHGIEVTERSATGAVAELTVRPEHLNAHGICHGGVLFLLADTAMAHASNSESAAVASHAEIDFLEPVSPGSHLRATARLRRRRKRLAIWDVVVDASGGEHAHPIAEFRGRTIEIGDRSSE